MSHKKTNNILPNAAVFFHNGLYALSVLSVISALTISGCSQKETTEQTQPAPQDQGSINKPQHKEVGKASWYGPGFQGQETANGEHFDQKDLTAAHPSLPMGSTAKVTNLENGKNVEVRINDRGPFTENRVIDVSKAAATELGMKKDGTTQVKIETKSSAKKVASARSVKPKKRLRKVISSN
ncbi:MAG: septal ring lytic transglycosylase RlpA family protein [Methylococcales bacterium]|nr:septal ring lytic transglycosylase RlpA family protein [Methylococcaceae bacterium]